MFTTVQNFSGMCRYFLNNVKSNLSSVHWIFLVSVVCLLFSSAFAKPLSNNEIEQHEHPILESHYPFFYTDTNESNLFSRASPRYGRASPRLGRAAPRLGRETRASPRLGRAISRFNHAGRYYDDTDSAANDYSFDVEPWMHEKRASPRLGRSSNPLTQQYYLDVHDLDDKQ